MEHFDHDYLDRLLFRLGLIEPSAKPAWGRMTPPGLVAHFAEALLYSMGRLGQLPDAGNWFTRKVLKHAILRGLVAIPRNVQAPPYAGADERAAADKDALHALLEEYLALVQAGELAPQRHPLFGPLTIDEWARLHVRHFEHHLRQFRV